MEISANLSKSGYSRTFLLHHPKVSFICDQLKKCMSHLCQTDVQAAQNIQFNLTAKWKKKKKK